MNRPPFIEQKRVEPKRIEQTRREFREQYSSVLFNSFINVFLVVLLFAFSLVYSALNITWDLRAALILPIAFLYNDVAFYVAHRFQQHQSVKTQEWAFRMHAIWHHGMFSDERMHVDSFNDMNMVILPFFVHGFVIGFIYLPLALFSDAYFGSDIGWIVLFTVTVHLCWYEVVHTLSHLKNPPVLRRLSKHHKQHHNSALMGKFNFGIATTVCDRLFRTRHKQ